MCLVCLFVCCCVAWIKPECHLPFSVKALQAADRDGCTCHGQLWRPLVVKDKLYMFYITLIIVSILFILYFSVYLGLEAKLQFMSFTFYSLFVSLEWEKCSVLVWSCSNQWSLLQTDRHKCNHLMFYFQYVFFFIIMVVVFLFIDGYFIYFYFVLFSFFCLSPEMF